jgi:uncharacterized protein YbaR (Trm112 family)
MVEGLLVCPVSRLPLTQTSIEDARSALGGESVRVASGSPPNVAAPEEALLRSDNLALYPIVHGVPILIAPEMIAVTGSAAPVNTSRDPYREAYEEMDFYSNWAERETEDIQSSTAFQNVRRAVEAGGFLKPGWLDATYDAAAQADAYARMAPIEGKCVIQVGGKGTHAVKFLIGGASEAWLVTPVLGEALFARALAASFGVEQNFKAVVAIAEELPFLDASFDRVYTGGCLHHTITSRAIPEIARILRVGGRFGAVEPWRAPLYGIGTRVFGKREVGVNCRPIDARRALPLFEAFYDAAVLHHGAVTRYPFLALSKLGVHPGLDFMHKITRLDDRLSSVVSPLRRSGSSVALVATK